MSTVVAVTYMHHLENNVWIALDGLNWQVEAQRVTSILAME